jgi:hypothetical protein
MRSEPPENNRTRWKQRTCHYVIGALENGYSGTNSRFRNQKRTRQEQREARTHTVR